MNEQRWILGTLVCVLASMSGLVRAADVVDAVSAAAFPKARQPQVAVSPVGKIYLAFGTGNAVYCTTSDDGKAFTESVKVGEVGVLALGMRRGPRIVATEKAVVVTAIGGKEGRGRDEDLLAWRSEDSGKTWKGPVMVNGVTASAREGLHHTVAAPDGTVYCVWLDLRTKKTQVYGAASADGGATWQNEKIIYESPDGSVCECCQPQAAFDAKGHLHVMWRNQVAGARDMYLTSSDDNGKTFSKAVKLGEGTWPLKACPMDGGGLAGEAGQGMVTVWMRKQEIFRCTPGQPESSLGKGEQPWGTLGPGGVHIVWVTARPGAVVAQSPGSKNPIKLADRGWDPVIAGPVGGKGPVVAWEEGPAGGDRMLRALLLTSPR